MGRNNGELPLIRVSDVEDEKVLVMMVAQYECTYCRRTVYLKMVKFMLCVFYYTYTKTLNRAWMNAYSKKKNRQRNKRTGEMTNHERIDLSTDDMNR